MLHFIHLGIDSVESVCINDIWYINLDFKNKNLLPVKILIT